MRPNLVRAAAGLFVAMAPLLCEEQKCAVDGAVLNSRSKAPVSEAFITLEGIAGAGATARRDATNAAPRTASTRTDAGGRFCIAALDRGQYRLTVVAKGFVSEQIGKIGDTEASLRIELQPEAATPGTVTDEYGEGVIRGTVSAYRRECADGHVRWISAGEAETDDRGEFWISRLKPGLYLLVCRPPGGLIELDPDSKLPQAYLPTYYPSAADLPEATLFRVSAGEIETSRDIRLARGRSVTVKGRLVNGVTGRAVPSAPMRYMSISEARLGVLPKALNMSGVDGSFHFQHVPVRDNVVEVFADTGGGSAGYRYALPAGTESVSFTIAPPRTLQARILDPDGSLELGGITLKLQTAGNEWEAPNSFHFSGSKGEYTLDRITPGHYSVMVGGLPGDAYVRSIAYGNAEVLGKTFEITAESGAELAIAIERAGGSLSGTVAEGDQPTVRGAVVVLLPANPADQHLFRSSVTDASGSFSISGIAPGEYRVMAWPAGEQLPWRNKQFLDRCGNGASVRVEAGGAVRIKLERSELGADCRAVADSIR